jgi:hypothetical protein
MTISLNMMVKYDKYQILASCQAKGHLDKANSEFKADPVYAGI